MLLCERKFEETYKKEAEGVSFCPYRICPIGAHSDHNLGKVTGFAIDRGIHIAYAPKMNGVIEMSSLQFSKRAQWHVKATPEVRQNDWADYLRGVVSELSTVARLSTGLCGVIEGDLPIGGLSSSAAVSIAFMQALCSVNGVSLSNGEIIRIAQAAENNYVGVNCGSLDPSCEVLSRKDKLLYLDCKDGSFELIETPANARPFKIAIFFSGIERNLAGTAFNMRIDEARSASYAIKAYAGMPYGKFKETCLRDIDRDTYERYKSRLPQTWLRRAEHWYTEFDRVEAGASAFRRGDIEEYGRLCFESGLSSIDNWETGSDELKTMYRILRETDGVYGGRFSGAGFKGCCMALIDPAFEESIFERVKREYLKAFPALSDRYKAVTCNSSDGTSI